MAAHLQQYVNMEGILMETERKIGTDSRLPVALLQ